MLRDLVPYAALAKEHPIVRAETLAETELPESLRTQLKAIVRGARDVSRFTTTIDVDKGKRILCIPNQYFRYAAEVRDCAIDVFAYFEILDKLRKSHGKLLKGTASEIEASLASADLPVTLTPKERVLFARFMSSDQIEARLDAKCPVNDDGSIRGSSDCFGSVVLKRIDVPKVSSNILGELVYDLTRNDAVYQQLVRFYADQAKAGETSASLASEDHGTVVADSVNAIPLPKPFLLLAGISGTGKTRFVQEQAKRSGDVDEHFLLVPVRPDWHEPSDLLGYVSRINGEQFVVTPLLKFMATAWRAVVDDVDGAGVQLKNVEAMKTYWVCLDEMNLAPVEQYFADFLAVVETRDWSYGKYTCAPLLPVHKWGIKEETLDRLGEELGFTTGDELWKHFVAHGMPLPPNLVIAGTVNMDETTHGFSRKVIDRAFTIDFGEFFPNDFDKFFVPDVEPVTLTFPRWSRVSPAELAGVAADSDGSKTIEFLKGVNAILENTSFRLAFRALNELLVAVRSFAPATGPELAAVWDDFLMAKLLPRLEGDAEKMDYSEAGQSLLTRLREHIEKTLTPLLLVPGSSVANKRPDLLQIAAVPLEVDLRTPKALSRMQIRLEKHNFTSFWP